RSWRRASGRLRPGGKDPRRGGGVALGGAQEGVRPDQADQRQVAVEARPGAPLVVAQPELLLAVLVEALDRPAPVAQPQLAGPGPVGERPGEVPLGLAALARQRALAEEPAFRP